MSYQPNNPNGQTTMANSSPVNIASDQSPIPHKVVFFTASTMVQRPANTTAYTVEDAITSSTSAPSALYIPNIVDTSGGAFFINEVIITSSAAQAVLPYFKLFISDTYFVPTNDNAAFDISEAENNANTTLITLNEQGSFVNSSRVAATNLQQIFKTNSGDKGVYVGIIADNAYTPVSAERFKITLKGYTT